MSIPKTVDSTLWSDSFTAILTDLENAPLTSFPHLVTTSLSFTLFRLQFEFCFFVGERLEENHAWLVETVSLFKKPNAASRVALTNCFFLIAYIKHPVKSKLVKQMDWNGDLFVATVNLLLLQHINSFRIFLLDFPPVEDREVQLSNAGGAKQPINEPSNGSLCSQKSSLLDAFISCVGRSNEFIDSFCSHNISVMFIHIIYIYIF
ncbi:hypothetical protein OIU74_004049 [Salix koriyanagi]|uniref:Uncharacterized protein n=1 Tax=Salix koriyanagi TaxID=2511006 RepID=A0A9Q0V0V7_9ROSI|nr:hypothetical protein OIU74_004049 [Salix koriyanagi]